MEKKKNIALVDDEEIIQDLITDVLEQAGFEVFAYGCSAEIIQDYEELGKRFDLVITDNFLDRETGTDVFWKLRAFDPSMKVIMLSGNSDDDFRRQCLFSGYCDFVEKPFSPQHLIQTIHRHTG